MQKRRAARSHSLIGPLLDKGGYAWLVNTARKNYWRVAAWMEVEDLIQEGQACYVKVRAHYPDQHPAVTMALFKSSYINRLHDLANRRTRQDSEIPYCLMTEADVAFFENRQIDEFAELLRIAAEAPPVVGRLLMKLFENPVPLSQPYARKAHRTRETFNERLCRIVGVDPESHDLHTALLELLGKTT